MSSAKLATDGKGRWYRRWNDGSISYQSRLSPKEEAELQLQYGEHVKGVDGYVAIKNKPEQVIDGEVRDSLRRIITEDTLQKIKDDASLKDIREGGGVLRYQPDMQRTGTHNDDDKRKEIYDLYNQAAKGSKDAENKLDGLWRLAMPRLKELEKSGKRLVITMCPNPNCDAGIDPEIGNCPVCGWNKYEKGYSKEFDAIIRGRDR